jgi:putative oxidoreductase
MQEDLGKLVVRFGTGGLLLLHGAHKLLTGIAPIRTMLEAHNVSSSFGYGVYLGEIAGPIMLILGVFSRIGGLLITVNMVVAILLAGTGALLVLNEYGGYALELETFYLLGGLTIILVGAGRFSFNIGGRWN